FVPDEIVGKALQLPGCAVGDRSVLADVDGAHHGGDELLLGPAERAIRHGPARRSAVGPSKLGHDPEDPSHLGDEVDLEPRLARFEKLLVLGRNLGSFRDPDDFHMASLSTLTVTFVPHRCSAVKPSLVTGI